MKRTARSSRILALLIALTMVVVAQVLVAQTGELEPRTNTVYVGGNLGIEPGTALGVAAGTGMTVAGVLDIGFNYGLRRPQGDAPEEQTAIGLTYAVTALKQGTAFPLSAQVYGDYSFRTASSQVLSDARLQKEGFGYSLGILLARDFRLFGPVELRVAGLAEWRLSRYVTKLTFTYVPPDADAPEDPDAAEPPVDYTEYPLTTRVTRLQSGGYAGLSVAIGQGAGVSAGCALLWDTDLNLLVRPELEVAVHGRTERQ